MGVCSLQAGHVVDASQETGAITNMNFKLCAIDIEVEVTLSMREYIFLIIVVGATTLVILILLSSFIYRYCCR